MSLDAGGSALERLRVRGEQQRLDSVAVLWMLLVIVITATTIYSALRFGNIEGFEGEGDWWFKLRFLASSGGALPLFGSVVGITLAVGFEGARSRLALRLATLLSGWVTVAGVVGAVVTFHDDTRLASPVRAFDGRVSGVAIYVVTAALGAVSATVAWRFSRSAAPNELS